MSDFCVFDIESYNFNEVYAIGMYNGKEYTSHIAKPIKNRIRNNNIFIKFLLDNLENNSKTYAHYGGSFDFLFILDYVNSCNDSEIVSIKLINSKIGKLIIRYENKILEFLDSSLILPASLYNLTKDFDVVHKKLKLDYDLGLEDSRLAEYLRNDCMGLYEVLEASKLTDRLTIASNSMNTFLNNFYNRRFDLKVSNNSDTQDSIFREGYIGGRVELYKKYGISLNYYDVNSLYPYVMRKNKYPE